MIQKLVYGFENVTITFPHEGPANTVNYRESGAVLRREYAQAHVFVLDIAHVSGQHEPIRSLHVFENFTLIVPVITHGHRIDAMILDKVIIDLFGKTEAASGVLTIGNYNVRRVFFSQLRQKVVQAAATRLAHHITDS
jgi:hypothetical protein